MVLAGLTEKFAPLALVPILLPPVATVYHLIVLLVDVAFKLEIEPAQIVAAVAVTKVGSVGNGFTVTVTEVRLALAQPAGVNASA